MVAICDRCRTSVVPRFMFTNKLDRIFDKVLSSLQNPLEILLLWRLQGVNPKGKDYTQRKSKLVHYTVARLMILFASLIVVSGSKTSHSQ